MAGYNEILVGRFARALQKVTGIKGSVPTSSLSSDLVATWQFFSGAENRYLDSWERFGTFTQVAAVVAQFGSVRFRNPPTSNVVAVVERITTTTGNAGAGVADQPSLTRSELATFQVDLANAVAMGHTALDSRGRPSPTCIMSNQAPAPAVGTNLLAVNVQANATVDWIITDIHELPLLPGSMLQVNSAVTNALFTVSFLWRERFLEESERS